MSKLPTNIRSKKVHSSIIHTTSHTMAGRDKRAARCILIGILDKRDATECEEEDTVCKRRTLNEEG
jgi:hypothetical protein